MTKPKDEHPVPAVLTSLPSPIGCRQCETLMGELRESRAECMAGHRTIVELRMELADLKAAASIAAHKAAASIAAQVLQSQEKL